MRKRRKTGGPSVDSYTLAEISKRLRMGINQTRQAAQRGDIPARRIGRRWIVPRAAWERWLLDGGKAA